MEPSAAPIEQEKSRAPGAAVDAFVKGLRVATGVSVKAWVVADLVDAVYAGGVAEGLRQAAETQEREAQEKLADRKLLRYPQGRPTWLGPGRSWPCGRCRHEVNALVAHRCVPTKFPVNREAATDDDPGPAAA